MRFVPLALAALAFTALASANAVSRLEGTVRDVSGGVVQHAVILCVGETTGFRFSVETGSDGSYVLSVPEGRYNIVVRRPGFRIVARLGVQALASGTVRADFKIAPENLSETMTIVGSPDVEDSQGNKTPSQAAVFVLNPDELRGLPHNDGTVTGLMALVPGVVFTPASRGEPGQFSSTGARPNTNRFTVDGVSANNAVAGAGWPSFLAGDRLPAMTALGTTQTLAVLDSIQDVTIESPDGAARLDQDPGAHVVIRTKSGAENFHGSFAYAGRPPALGASDWFANRYGLGSNAPELHSETGSFGGPLQRGKTFLFVAAERLSLRQGYAWTTTVPSLLARNYVADLAPLLNEFPKPNGRNLTFGISEYIGQSRTPSALTSVNARVDRQISQTKRLFLRLADTPSWSEAGLTQTNHTNYRGRVVALGSTWTTGSWIHDSRVSFSRNEAESSWSSNGGGDKPLPAFYSQYPSLAADFSNISVGGAGSVSLGQSGRNLQNQWQVSQTSALHDSRHDASFGLGYVDLAPARHGGDTNVTVAFGTPTNLLLQPPAPVWITNSRIEATSVNLRRLSAFARDAWKINSRLSLTFGVGASWVMAPRLNSAANLFIVDELTESFTPVEKGTPVWRGPALRLTPTVAAAWRVGGGVVRASWAVFQDAGSSAATDQLNGIPYQQMRTPNGVGLGFLYSPSLLDTVQLGHGYARDFKLATYQRWNVRVERDLHEVGSLQFGYTGMTGIHELRKQIFLNPTTTLGGVTFVSSNGESTYHALNAVYRRSLARGFQANVSYTWSHSIDLGSADSSVFVVSPTQHASADRGSSDFDARHVASAALTYSTPRHNGLVGRLTSDWTFGTLVSARSGFPMDVLISETLEGFAIANYRAAMFPGAKAWVTDPSLPGGRGLNPNSFALPLRGLSPLGRNTLRGFGLWQADMSAERAFMLPHAWRVALRADAYNLFNHPQFGEPARYASNPLFGQSQSPLNLMLGSGSPGSGESPALVTGAPRTLQLSLRLSF